MQKMSLTATLGVTKMSLTATLGVTKMSLKATLGVTKMSLIPRVIVNCNCSAEKKQKTDNKKHINASL